MFFPGNSQKQTRENVSIDYSVETPKCFSLKKTAFFGIISLLIVVMVCVPELLNNTYAYGVDNYEKNIESTIESNMHTALVRNHFSTDFDNDTNYTNEFEGFTMLKERTNVKKHFSYEYTNSENAKFDPTKIDFHTKRQG